MEVAIAKGLAMARASVVTAYINVGNVQEAALLIPMLNPIRPIAEPLQNQLLRGI
jgi:hypothetical protein